MTGLPKLRREAAIVTWMEQAAITRSMAEKSRKLLRKMYDAQGKKETSEKGQQV